MEMEKNMRSSQPEEESHISAWPSLLENSVPVLSWLWELNAGAADGTTE